MEEVQEQMKRTGKVDGAERVDVVVHVGGVRAALAAVRARKLRPRSSQPNAQPVPAAQPLTIVKV